mgnify:CR=1 FL=1
MKKQYIHFIVFICIFLLSFGTLQNPFTNDYVESLKYSTESIPESIPVTTGQDKLYSEIEKKAIEYHIPPEDAKIDYDPRNNIVRISAKVNYLDNDHTGYIF